MIRRLSRDLRRYLPPGLPILSLLFILFALPTCMFLALAVPTGEVPDEAAHVARAGSLLHGELLGQRRPRLDGAGHPMMAAGVVTNPGPVFADFAFSWGTPKKMSVTTLQRLQAIQWGAHLQYFGVPNTAPYFPIFYVPSAIGLGFAHVIQVTPLIALMYGRVFGAIGYLILGLIALGLARRGRSLLFATLVLPMTLWLAGSFNEDAVLVATTCVAVALLTRAMGPRGVAYWGAGVLLACVIAVKPPYLLMSAVMLLPCTGWRRGEFARAIVGIALASVPGVLWEVIALRFVATPFVFGAPYLPGPLWPGDPKHLFPGTDTREQLRVFLHNPLLAITMPWQTMMQWGNWVLKSMIGILGPLDVGMPTPVYSWWLGVLPLAALADIFASPQESRGPRLDFALIVLLAIAATIFAIYDLQYLSWTLVGKTTIDGVQGRYALPLLAMIAITLPVIRVPAGRIIRGVLSLPTVGMACFGMVYLPQLVVYTYYLR